MRQDILRVFGGVIHTRGQKPFEQSLPVGRISINSSITAQCLEHCMKKVQKSSDDYLGVAVGEVPPQIAAHESNNSSLLQIRSNDRSGVDRNCLVIILLL